jgi:phosphopantetheinyl transferase
MVASTMSRFTSQSAKDLPQIQFCFLLVADYVSQLAELELLLSFDEQERGSRFSRVQDRIQFVLGRAAVRRICSTAFGIKPTAVKIELSRSGKPYVICPNSQFEFNISHANGIVALAWNRSHPVGIDVECTDQSLPFQEISRIAFSKTERAVLAAADHDHVQETFFRIWVRKEAVLKAEGCGICEVLRSFAMANQYHSQVVWPSNVRFPPSLRVWKMIDLSVASRYLLAIAMPPTAEVVLCTPEEIGFRRS